ncbi:MAG: hypothetical protein ACI9LM_005563 [Alteromonadaceae bacterium]|jgi:hypothetical protein
MYKIIQIGFNKCGTTSLHDFFLANNIASVHYKDCHGPIASFIYHNNKLGLPLLSGYDQYTAFLDMEYYVDGQGDRYVSLDFYQKLYEQYPEAIFILNERNVGDWLSSRKNHLSGRYIERNMLGMSLTEGEVIELWRSQYLAHIESVLFFFSCRPEANFIYLNIDNDQPNKLANNLRKFGVDIFRNELPHSLKTTDLEAKKRISLQVNALVSSAKTFEQTNKTLSEKIIIKAIELAPHRNDLKEIFNSLQD